MEKLMWYRTMSLALICTLSIACVATLGTFANTVAQPFPQGEKPRAVMSIHVRMTGEQRFEVALINRTTSKLAIFPRPSGDIETRFQIELQDDVRVIRRVSYKPSGYSGFPSIPFILAPDSYWTFSIDLKEQAWEGADDIFQEWKNMRVVFKPNDEDKDLVTNWVVANETIASCWSSRKNLEFQLRRGRELNRIPKEEKKGSEAESVSGTGG